MPPSLGGSLLTQPFPREFGQAHPKAKSWMFCQMALDLQDSLHFRALPLQLCGFLVFLNGSNTCCGMK